MPALADGLTVSREGGPDRTLLVRVLTSDPKFEADLGASVSRLSTVAAHVLPTSVDRPDILLVDADSTLDWDPPLEATAEEDGPLTIVVAREFDARTRALGTSLGAVGYLKKVPGLENFAALVLQLGAMGQLDGGSDERR